MHGMLDQVVPPRHSEDKNEPLRKAGKTVRYVGFEGQSHSNRDTDEEIRQLEESIRFLAPLLQ